MFFGANRSLRSALAYTDHPSIIKCYPGFAGALLVQGHEEWTDPPNPGVRPGRPVFRPGPAPQTPLPGPTHLLPRKSEVFSQPNC